MVIFRSRTKVTVY